MGSETDEVLIEDSDDSLLDIKELNDIEYDIPTVVPPTLESILWEFDSNEGSDSTSLHSFQSLTLKFRSMLYHCKLQGISSQVSSAGDRVNAGLPTVIINSLKFVAIGTSHGYILAFDSEQKLCWCSHDKYANDQGAVSALAFNLDSTRLLVGYERGYIAMIDTSNAEIIRRLPDAHAPQTAVLQLRFTVLNNLALCGDSSGCVFSLNFSRPLGVRKWDSKCLFSGARGEVCVFEPLVQGQELLGHNIVVAMATLSKVIVISIKPKLRVLFSQQLPRIPTSLPLISWQMVVVGKNLQPVLAWGRGTELNYTRIVLGGYNSSRIRLHPLRYVRLAYSLTALHWLGSRHLALLDTSENLRLIEVRTQRELELVELTNAGLVYSSAHFKALAVGGGVSEAFALAGERACYNSLSSRGEQLLILGTKAVHMIKLRSWHERLMYLSDQGKWAEALNLAANEGQHREKSIELLLDKFLTNINQNCIDRDTLTAAINCCVKLSKIDILCEALWDSISSDQYNKDWYFTNLGDHVCNGSLTYLTPSITQILVSYLEEKNIAMLESVLLQLDLSCMDLNQVLNICKQKRLYEAWIHITTNTIGDYTSAFTEFLGELTPENHKLGNTMLVYVSACLAGLAYPKGVIPKNDVLRVKYDVLRCLEATHSVNSKENEQTYPYLRALLMYNTRECLNVVELAFTEDEFSGEMGLLQRQRLIQILLQIVAPPDFNDSQIISLACFITRLITSNNLKVEDSILETVVKSLTDMISKPLTLRDHMDREQSWLDLLQTKNLLHLDSEHLLQMALETKCYRVAEFLYEKQNDYSSILMCYLKDPFRKSDVFGYILANINTKNRSIQEQFIVNFKEILAIDSKKTADVVIEHYPQLIEELCMMLESNNDLQYKFLHEIIFSELKLPPHISEQYLELLCTNQKECVLNYVQFGLCRVQVALKITQKHKVHAATAYLLEQTGDYNGSLDLLLKHNMANAALELCIRASEDIDANGAQLLWLKLLKYQNNVEFLSLRQLLHAAAPHVPSAQLLELVSNVNLGDVQALFEGMLADCSHDTEMLSITLKLLSKDLHQGLATSLSANGKGVSITRTICSSCQGPLVNYLKKEQNTAIYGCGHCFHSSCLVKSENESCLQCRKPANFVNITLDAKEHSEAPVQKLRRPDLEGHF